MITFSIQWHLMLYIILMVIPVVYAVCSTVRGGSGYFASLVAPIAWLEAIVIDVVLTLIYGGIAWW